VYKECGKRHLSLGDLNVTNKTNKKTSFIDRWEETPLLFGLLFVKKPEHLPSFTSNLNPAHIHLTQEFNPGDSFIFSKNQ
jgi:hypothetical protein